MAVPGLRRLLLPGQLRLRRRLLRLLRLFGGLQVLLDEGADCPRPRQVAERRKPRSAQPVQEPETGAETEPEPEPEPELEPEPEPETETEARRERETQVFLFLQLTIGFTSGLRMFLGYVTA